MAAGERSSSDAAPQRWITTELGTRVVSAIVLGILALLATYRGGWAFALFWLVAGIAVLVEWINITGVRRALALQIVLGAGLGGLTAAYLLGADLGPCLAIVAVSTLAALVIPGSMRDRIWAVAGLFYAGVISLVPPIVRDDPQLGLVGLLWMFAVVWTTDVAAYFTGRRLGGPKLWPQISPKKTWSGFVGGLIAGTAAGVLVVVFSAQLGGPNPGPLLLVAVATALASGASQLGDLGESALKRRFDVKDSSHIIPGHGGVMDRVDGFWAVAALVGLAMASVRLAQVFV